MKHERATVEKHGSNEREGRRVLYWVSRSHEAEIAFLDRPVRVDERPQNKLSVLLREGKNFCVFRQRQGELVAHDKAVFLHTFHGVASFGSTAKNATASAFFE